jgi:sulfite reductase (NADPH) flavoprotein alpha-component
MTVQSAALPVALIPETAPFSPEQRAWLSGFLAAALLPEGQSPGAPVATQLGADDMARMGLAGAPQALASNDDAPWHDPSVPLDQRMDMAKERPLAPRLMAAMAQQDCGQCGYSCSDYANAIFEGREARLNLCAPGGKETARKLKELAAEQSTTVSSAPPPRVEKMESSSTGVASRESPAHVGFISRHRLTTDGSEKETYHVELDLTESGLEYAAGDSCGLFPSNDLGLVDQIIAMLGASHVTPMRGKTLRNVLRDDVSLGAAPDTLFELISYLCGGSLREKARALSRGEDPDGDTATLDVLGALQKFPNVRPHPEAFVDALEPLQPRLYSISSSPKVNPGKLSLTVDAVRYIVGKRRRLGVASTFLADRIQPAMKLRAYIQKAHQFSLPADISRPIIMVGPGTGIAPFRAFLQDRAATQGSGRNWLFFGHQRQMSDFFYRDELEQLRQSGVLTRLSLAWSRDGAEKFYVQDRMREVGAALWQWLAEGAHFYVCGDAKRMAKDVEAAMVDIVARHGARSLDEAIAFVGDLKKAGRYQADVY